MSTFNIFAVRSPSSSSAGQSGSSSVSFATFAQAIMTLISAWKTLVANPFIRTST